MVGQLVNILPVRLFKYGLVTELLRETCKGGLILSISAAYESVSLRNGILLGFDMLKMKFLS